MTEHTEIITDPLRFAAMQPQWRDLLAASDSNSLSLTYEWLSTWWGVYGEHRQLRVVAIWSGQRLLGAAPLLRRTSVHWHFGVLPYRRYDLLASGEAPGDAICSDYLDWLAVRGEERRVVAAIMRALADELRREWHEIVLPDISSASPILEALQHECRNRGLVWEIVESQPSPHIKLPDTWDALLGQFGSSLRYKVRRGRKDFEKQGGTYRVVSTAAEIPDAYRTLVRLHEARWRARGLAGAFASPLRNAFHTRFLPLALERGWLRLGILALPDRPIGAIYNFSYEGRVYFYQSGIELQQQSTLRPGVLMHAYELEDAIARNCREYDFLKQDSPDYKDEWANANRTLASARIAERGSKQSILRVLRSTKRRLRPLKQRLVEQLARASAQRKATAKS